MRRWVEKDGAVEKRTRAQSVRTGADTMARQGDVDKCVVVRVTGFAGLHGLLPCYKAAISLYYSNTSRLVITRFSEKVLCP